MRGMNDILALIVIRDVRAGENGFLRGTGRLKRATEMNGEAAISAQVEEDEAVVMPIGEGEGLEIVCVFKLNMVVGAERLVPGGVTSSDACSELRRQKGLIDKLKSEIRRPAPVRCSPHINDRSPKRDGLFGERSGGEVVLILGKAEEVLRRDPKVAEHQKHVVCDSKTRAQRGYGDVDGRLGHSS